MKLMIKVFESAKLCIAYKLHFQLTRTEKLVFMIGRNNHELELNLHVFY